MKKIAMCFKGWFHFFIRLPELLRLSPEEDPSGDRFKACDCMTLFLALFFVLVIFAVFTVACLIDATVMYYTTFGGA